MSHQLCGRTQSKVRATRVRGRLLTHRRAVIGDQKRRLLAWLQRHVGLVHGEGRLVRPRQEMSASVASPDLAELEDHTHHPSVDAPVLGPVAEDRVDLPRAAAVELAVALALFAHDAARRLEPDVLADELLQHPQHRGVVDEQRGRATRDIAVLWREGLWVFVDADDLVTDFGALLRRNDRRAHQKPRAAAAHVHRTQPVHECVVSSISSKNT